MTWLSAEATNDRKKETVYAASDVVRAGGSNDDLYLATEIRGIGDEKGERGSAETLDWDRQNPVGDGNVTWSFWEELSRNEHMNRMRVVVFAPFAHENTSLPSGTHVMRTRETVAVYGMLTYSADLMEKARRICGQIVQAFTYPAIVVLIAFGIG